MSPNIVTRLPRSVNSVRTVTYLNDGVVDNPEAYVSTSERDHQVVAGHNPTLEILTLVGGTFDHLHPGHKILLSITAYLSSRKLICGITGTSIEFTTNKDDALLKNKKYAQFLESISLRIENVRKFLTLIARNLELELIPIQDVYGPTAYDPEISALVISEETKAGADSIATLRKERNLPSLEIYIIDVIGSNPGKLQDKDIAELKLSSTKIRENLAKQNSRGS